MAWTNKRADTVGIHERVDRVIVTIGWQNEFPKAFVTHLLAISSNRRSILINLEGKINNPKSFVL